MIEARAVVVRTEKGTAWIRPLQDHGCGRCNEPGGCHAPQFAEMFKGHDRTIAIEGQGLCVDDRVRVIMDEGAPLRAAWASYGLGTALALAGAALGVWVAPSAQADLGATVGLVSGCALSLLALRVRARKSYWRLRVERDDACAGQRA